MEDTAQIMKDKLEEYYGQDNVWTNRELLKEFAVESFLAPFVMVRRKSDGVQGTMEFTHSPRFYFNFVEDTK